MQCFFCKCQWPHSSTHTHVIWKISRIIYCEHFQIWHHHSTLQSRGNLICENFIIQYLRCYVRVCDIGFTVFFKCLNGLAPPYLAELITVKENSCSCQLRSDGCLQEKKTNNKFGDRAFSICGPVLWNRLPKCMKEINSLDKFKKELKTHLFKEAFG